MIQWQHVDFQSYPAEDGRFTINRITPLDGYYLHTFFDICPWSPSGRYLALTRIPFQDREPLCGEPADIVIVDLRERKQRTVYSTRGWGVQLGANLQWGADDSILYANEIKDDQPATVKIDIEADKHIFYTGSKYDLSDSENDFIGFPHDLINVTQSGYGVPLYRTLTEEASSTEGIWRVLLPNGERSLLLSLKQAAESTADYRPGNGIIYYFFHCKYNRQENRIFVVLRGMKDGHIVTKSLLTFRSDRTDMHVAIPDSMWRLGGHHPNWAPDGEHIVMNLKPDGKTMRFCRFRYDGSDFTILSEHRGGGHPSITADGRFLLTDCYFHEPMARADGFTPLRFIDCTLNKETTICMVNTLKLNDVLRVDPHPVWRHDFKQICFNGTENGMRQVYIAEMK